MLASFLLSLREGLEAALIIGIVLGVLFKLKRSDLKGAVWLGVGSAVLLSVAVAIALSLLGMEFEGRGEEIFEGIVMLLAAGVLTWMIFWMHRSARTLKAEIETKTRDVLQGQNSQGLFALAFLAVFREGIELVLFLLAAGQNSSPLQTLTGALAGLVGAVILGWLLFNSARSLSLRSFFQVTNVLLIIFAAGLVGVGIHELNEAGLVPAIVDHVWDVNGILSDKSDLGLLLKALVGYNGDPSLTEALAYLVYLGGISLTLILRRQSQKQITATGVAD